jgi:4-amino-4-deoxy-L-arabinose transferase-like glycosyltransferase
MNEKTISTRGRIWFEALAGKQAKHVPSVPSVLVADTTLQKERVRFLAVVPDPDNRFPGARQGQTGLQEGWNLAKQVRDAIKADENGEKRAIMMIAEALVPVFFVMFLGYFAGARRITYNQHVASLTVLVMTFALPVALFVGVAQTSRSGLEENGKLFLVLVISMLVIFGITFALNHYVFRLGAGENAVQS